MKRHINYFFEILTQFSLMNLNNPKLKSNKIDFAATFYWWVVNFRQKAVYVSNHITIYVSMWVLPRKLLFELAKFLSLIQPYPPTNEIFWTKNMMSTRNSSTWLYTYEQVAVALFFIKKSIYHLKSNFLHNFTSNNVLHFPKEIFGNQLFTLCFSQSEIPSHSQFFFFTSSILRFT